MTDPLQRFGERVTQGVFWAFATSTGGRLISLALLIVLARLLAPTEFGLVALALVFVTYVETVGDLGTATALIYWPDRRRDAAQVTFVVNLVMAGVWFGVTVVAAPAVATLFRSAEAEALLRVLAWSFPIKALGSTHDALCVKDLRFRARTIPEIGMVAVKAVVAVGLAFGGFGAWSLIWAQLAGMAAWSILLWLIVPWRPRVHWPTGLLGPMLRYGRGIVAVNVLAVVVHHADVVIVGRMLSVAALGFYQMASKVPETGLTVLMRITSKVLFPVFSRLQSASQELDRAYLVALRYISLFALPGAIALASAAEPLVLTLFGEAWRPAIPVLRLLALYTGLRCVGTHAGDVLKASGRTSLLAGLGVAKAVLLIPALLVGSLWGAVGVAASMVIVVAVTVPLNLIVVARLLRLQGRDLVRSVREAFFAAAVVGVVLASWSYFGPTLVAPLQLVSMVGLALLSFVAVVRVSSPNLFQQALAAVRGAVRSNAAGEAAVAGRNVLGETGRFVMTFDGRGVVRYFLDSIFVPHRIWQRVMLLLARGRAPLIGRWPLVRKRRSDEHHRPSLGLERRLESSRETRLVELLQEESGSWLEKAAIGSGAVGWILQRNYPGGERDRWVALLFNRGPSPAAVLKLRSRRSAGPSLAKEYGDLRVLAGRLPASLRATVPEPLVYGSLGEFEALLISALRGRSGYVEMQASLRPATVVRGHFRRAGVWLARFQIATASPNRVVRLADQVAKLLDNLSDHRLQLVVRSQSDLRETLASTVVPEVFSHGDFWCRNTLFDASATDLPSGVVDWERLSTTASPLRDLFHFPLTYGLNYLWVNYRRLPPERAFRRMFLERNRVSNAMRSYLRAYCSETGLELHRMPALFRFYLLTVAAEDQALGAPGAGSKWLRFAHLFADGEGSALTGWDEGGIDTAGVPEVAFGVD